MDLVGRVRAICNALPEAYEEEAWVGRRWRIRQRTFAHVLDIVDGMPQAYARAAGTPGPATVLTFRATGPEVLALREAGAPFFYGGWGRDALGLHLDGATDWDEVRELLTESYCLLAPKRLADQVVRPGTP